MSLEILERDVTQPMEIMLIRHGESEANRVQRAEKNGLVSPLAAEVYGRHDFQHHLTAQGVRQAKAARAVLLGEGIVPEIYFDEHYVSTYQRPIETFAYITDGNADPLTSLWLIERDWGRYGNTPLADRTEMFAETERLKEISTFMTRYDGGENIPDVATRLKHWIDTINREQTDKKVMAVVHGELMWTARYLFEGLTTKQWEAMDKDKALRIGNCCILWYSRQNPENPDETSRTISGGWRRMIDPFEPDKSPYGGEWQKLPGRTRLMGKDILAAAEAYPRLPDEEIPALVEEAQEAIDVSHLAPGKRPMAKLLAHIRRSLPKGRSQAL